MVEIEKLMRSKVYFAGGTSTTKAGLQKFIGENQQKEIIIIDEIDKMPIKDQEGLLTMMERGLLSRFTVLEIPEYTYPEFEGISTRIVNKLPQNTVIQIASSVWRTGSRDIRDVLKIAKLCTPSDGEEDITRLISIHQKYHKTGNDYN
jgi:hypothetical protein